MSLGPFNGQEYQNYSTTRRGLRAIQHDVQGVKGKKRNRFHHNISSTKRRKTLKITKTLFLGEGVKYSRIFALLGGLGTELPRGAMAPGFLWCAYSNGTLRPSTFCPSVCMKKLTNRWRTFHKILCWGVYLNSVELFQFWLNWPTITLFMCLCAHREHSTCLTPWYLT